MSPASGRIACALSLLWLAACATAPPGAADHSLGSGAVQAFQLTGRLAIRQPQRSDVVRLDWVHDAGQDHIRLSSPLGGEVMQLDEAPGHVRLQLANRAPMEAADDRALMQSVLGYTLPVQGLLGWVTGRLPADDRRQVDGKGEDEQVRFDQDGWSGTLAHWRMVGEERLPGLITVSRDDLQLRLVVDTWSVVRDTP